VRLIRSALGWLDARLRLGAAIRDTAAHPVPRRSASWWYVFGSGAFTLFLLQIATGICLALVYVPSADEAFRSLEVLNFQQPLGWFLRAMHGWGSNFMVALVLIHLVQVFLFGAYKFPRELTWMVGVILLVGTLGMAFSGQVLRWDQDAYWGLGIVASIVGRIPVVGGQLVQVVLGGPIIAGETLTRFFALHVFLIPAVLIALVGVHLLLVLKLGINEYPMPGRLVNKDTYAAEYEEMVHRDGVPFVPVAFQKDLVFAGVLICAVMFCAAVFGPFGPGGAPDPTIIQTTPRPDYFFLWIFSVAALMPPAIESFALLVGPALGILALLLLPLWAGVGEKSWRRRPVGVLVLIFALLGLGILTHLGNTSPWSPVMDAWSALPVPAKRLEGKSPLVRQGALVFQLKQCRNCHALGDEGGRRGPALDDVATRLTHDQLIRQVLQGGGNMPAYGANLSPAETTALVALLETFHPANQAPARDPAAAVAPARADPGPPAK
jgi:ubiquinol-cytochrome c reductase cytochrome b subunit